MPDPNYFDSHYTTLGNQSYHCKMAFAKKSYGQHFLTNESIAERIALALNEFGAINHVLEVGPGRGMLSKYLVSRHTSLALVDADQDMIDHLRRNPLFDKTRLISGDFLKLDLKGVFNQESFYIIGNFPYNISSQIVFKMIDNRSLVPGMVGMFQKEMAQRIAHAPGSKEYGVISVLTQAYYDVEYLFTVNEGNFNPPPKVKSGVIRFKRKPNVHLECNEVLFKSIVKACFLQKRKMIRNSLKSLLPADILEDTFYDKRPEQLSVEDYITITRKADDYQVGRRGQ
jgi:16S rRNA (adenine1518-N6/adenine1519-N6)-dimethyltransferase